MNHLELKRLKEIKEEIDNEKQEREISLNQIFEKFKPNQKINSKIKNFKKEQKKSEREKEKE